MIRDIELTRPEVTKNRSRGRNRWFQAASICIQECGSFAAEPHDRRWPTVRFQYLRVAVESSRKGRLEPVILGLTYQDAETLGAELLKMTLTRADVLHRQEAIYALRAILAKLENEDTGAERALIRDREDPAVHQVTGLNR